MAGYIFTVNFTAYVAWKFFETSNTISIAVSLGYPSITNKSNQFTGKKAQAVLFFEETKRVNSCLTHCNQKNEEQTLVLSVFKKKSLKMKLQVKFRAEDLHRTYCRHFRTNLLFWWSIFDGTNIHGTAFHRKTFM